MKNIQDRKLFEAAMDNKLELTLPKVDPDDARRTAEAVIADYYGANAAAIKAISVDASYSSYYQQDPNWKCYLTIDFGRTSALETKEIKKLVKDAVKSQLNEESVLAKSMALLQRISDEYDLGDEFFDAMGVSGLTANKAFADVVGQLSDNPEAADELKKHKQELMPAIQDMVDKYKEDK